MSAKKNIFLRGEYGFLLKKKNNTHVHEKTYIFAHYVRLSGGAKGLLNAFFFYGYPKILEVTKCVLENASKNVFFCK